MTPIARAAVRTIFFLKRYSTLGFSPISLMQTNIQFHMHVTYSTAPAGQSKTNVSYPVTCNLTAAQARYTTTLILLYPQTLLKSDVNRSPGVTRDKI